MCKLEGGGTCLSVDDADENDIMLATKTPVRMAIGLLRF